MMVVFNINRIINVVFNNNNVINTLFNITNIHKILFTISSVELNINKPIKNVFKFDIKKAS